MMEAKKHSPLPCPFCGSDKIRVEREDIPWGVLQRKIEWWKLTCEGCLSGATYPTEEGIVQKWNARHAANNIERVEKERDALLALAHDMLGFEIETPKDYKTKGADAFSPLCRHIIDLQNKARVAIASVESAK